MLSFFELTESNTYIADYIDYTSGSIIVEGEKQTYQLMMNPGGNKK